MTPAAVSQLPILLVDDEPSLLRSASLLLRAAGIAPILTLDDSRMVLSRLAEDKIGVVVLDLTMPHLSGQALLEQITANYPHIPAIVMTATHDLETAVQCMQAGAIDYLAKPVEKNRLVTSVRRALERRALREEMLSLKERLLSDTPHQREAFAEVVTQNKTMQALFRYVEAIAQSPQPVLITGETGTGKELMARAVHRLAAPRGDFVAVNVAGLDDQVFSDTLFGHTRGAFTGADRPRDGLIIRAEEGTLFLDEIGDLAAVSQVKLLRLLQEGTYYPLGADQPRQSRARREDIPLLVNHCLAKAAAVLHKPVPTPPLALYQLLNTYAFPGNVRELEAMVFDAVARHPGGGLPLQAFKDAIEAGRPLVAGERGAAPALPSQSSWDTEPLPTLKEAEDALVAAALRHADGNQGVAAGLLGLSRQALNKRLKRRQPLPELPHA